MAELLNAAPAAAPSQPPQRGSAAPSISRAPTPLAHPPVAGSKRPTPDSSTSPPPSRLAPAPGTLFDPTSLHLDDDSRDLPGVELVSSLWTKGLHPALSHHIPLVENSLRADEQATHALAILGFVTGLGMRFAERVRDKDVSVAPPLWTTFERAFIHASEGRTPHYHLPSKATTHPTTPPTADFASVMQEVSCSLSRLAEAQAGFARAQESSQKALVNVTTRLDKLERKDPGKHKDKPNPNPATGGPSTGPPPPMPPSTQLPSQPTPMPAIPLSYAAAAAIPAPPTSTASSTSGQTGKSPRKEKQLPKPSVKAKTPTLVVNFKGNPIPATQRPSDRSTTAQLRALIATIPTASALTLLAANWNGKGNCVLTFATGPRTIDQIDKHADIFAQSVCQGRDATASRVEPRTKLQVSMVPVWDLNATEPFNESDLLAELLVNRSIRESDLASTISYTKPYDKIDSSLQNCPVTFWVHDKDGTTSQRILAKPIFLFGKRLRVTRYRNLPSLSQCTRCQKLGHTAKGCKAPVACAICGLGHKTENHRQQCRQCAAEAATSAECPHPSCCVNCLGAHPATTSRSLCKAKRRYARAPEDNPDDPTSEDGMDA